MFANPRSVVTFTLAALVAAVSPAAAASAASGQASSSVTATVRVTDEMVTITVHENGHAAANQQVTVTPVGEASVAASGTYTTDANGQVRFEAPEEPATVRLRVDSGAGQAAALVRLEPPESGTWQTTVSLTADGSAEGDATTRASVDGPTLPAAVPHGLAQLRVVQAGGASAQGGLAVDAGGASDAVVTANGEAAAHASGDASASADGEHAESDAQAESEAEAESDAQAESDGDDTSVTVSASGSGSGEVQA